MCVLPCAMTTATNLTVPVGFDLLNKPSPFLTMLGPVYAKGMGPSASEALSRRFGTLDAIMSGADKIKGVVGENLRNTLDWLPRARELATDKPILFVCKSGQRSAVAAEFAATTGLTDLYNVEGGTLAWIAAGYDVEK